MTCSSARGLAPWTNVNTLMLLLLLLLFFFAATQPPIQWVRVFFSPEVELLGREAYHSYPAIAEVKNTLIYTATAPISSWRSVQ
jgi:hypothetical protein